MCFAEWYYNIPWLTARVAPSTLGAMQQQWINGWDSVQAVNGNFCIHMYTRNKGCGSLCSCKHQTSLQKLGLAHGKPNTVVASLIALPYRVFLNFACHAIQSRMTRTKCDPADQMIWATQPSFNSVTDTQETSYRYTLHDSCYKVAFSSRLNKPLNS